MNPYLKDLTPEELRNVRYDDIRIQPQTETELFNWVKGYFGWQLARRAICPGHHAPLSVLADLVFERVLDVIILANRTGGKTLLLAIANLFDALFKEKCEIASVGAIKAQAQKCFSYFRDMVEGDLLKDEVPFGLSQNVSRLRNGSEIRVLPGTMTGVNSPHPHKARADEVELIEWDILQQFFSMAKSGGGILGQNILASTRKTTTGSMQRLLDLVNNDRSFPFVLRQWCVWEVLANNPLVGPNCPCKEFSRRDGKTFFEACQGRCAESDGFYEPQDAWRKFSTLDDEVWDSEWECLRPARKGVIYKDMPDDRFLRLDLNPAWNTWAFCDWGYVDPFTFYVAQNDGGDNIYVLREIYATGLSTDDMLTRVGDLFEEMGLQKKDVTIYPDPRGSTEIADFRNAGFQMKSKAVEIDGGVKWVKKWVHGHNHPRLFVDGEMCPNFKREMTEGYQYKPGSETPDDKNNHAMDALRYGVVGKYPIRVVQETTTGVPVAGGDGHKSGQVRTPTSRETKMSDDARRMAEQWDYPRPGY